MLAPKFTPPFVYKYCSAKRAIQIVGDLTIFLAPAAGQNDLYEFRARSLYRDTDESRYRVFAKTLVAEGWYATFDEALAASKELDAIDTDARYQAFLEALHRSLDRIMAHSGVTCFSSERNNQRMWGTYGDNHSGAVIEFSTSPLDSRLGGHFGPVIYTTSKLDLCPSAFLLEDMRLNEQLMSSMLYVKHADWQDEKEWRLILFADEEQSKQERIASFERSGITRIFIGPRISQEDEATLRIAAEAHSPEIPIFRRVIDPLLAKEELSGYEQIEDFGQLAYWFPNLASSEPPKA
ncbi:DUF2971 domain-containing protein [Mesorhizobium sp. M0598]|uniref:DUF2971 domain-containing protein n=1 Tax=Mesorhizobium sp. M0598 TaxID=2956968 RepID=UPI00333640FC